MVEAARRHWRRWLALMLFVAVLTTAFVNLGFWQLRRLDERRAANAVVVANENAPVVPAESVFNHPIEDSDQWQRVSARGVYDASRQFQVRYRSNDGAPGEEVVTPLRLESGLVILVDRGFIPRPKGQGVPTSVPPAPAGTVTITGHVRRSEQGPRVAIEPANGMVRLINSSAIGESLGIPVADGYVGLLTSSVAQEGGLVPIVVPTLDDGPHFWYAVQWFLFCGFALTGLVVMIRRDVVEVTTGEPAGAKSRKPKPNAKE